MLARLFINIGLAHKLATVKGSQVGRPVNLGTNLLDGTLCRFDCLHGYRKERGGMHEARR